MSKTDYKVDLYENDKIYSFSHLSGQEMSSLENEFDILFGSDELEDIEGQPWAILHNVNSKIQENERILITPENYGASPWGKVEVVFTKLEKPDNIALYEVPIIQKHASL